MSTAVSEEALSKCVTRSTHEAAPSTEETTDHDIKCSICQVKYPLIRLIGKGSFVSFHLISHCWFERLRVCASFAGGICNGRRDREFGRMQAWISRNMHKPVAADEELVPHMQVLSSTVIFFFVVRICRSIFVVKKNLPHMEYRFLGFFFPFFLWMFLVMFHVNIPHQLFKMFTLQFQL